MALKRSGKFVLVNVREIVSGNVVGSPMWINLDEIRSIAPLNSSQELPPKSSITFTFQEGTSPGTRDTFALLESPEEILGFEVS